MSRGVAVSSPQRRRWLSEDRQDPLRPRVQPSWWVFLLAPILFAVAGAGLVAIIALVGSALVGVFIYSFAIIGVVAVYIGLHELWTWIRR